MSFLCSSDPTWWRKKRIKSQFSPLALQPFLFTVDITHMRPLHSYKWCLASCHSSLCMCMYKCLLVAYRFQAVSPQHMGKYGNLLVPAPRLWKADQLGSKDVAVWNTMLHVANHILAAHVRNQLLSAVFPVAASLQVLWMSLLTFQSLKPLEIIV